MHARARGALAGGVLGAGAARIGKGGQTDKDGKVVASVVVGLALIFFMAEVVSILVARSMGHDIFDASFALLIAPAVCVACSLGTIRLVFPLNELASFRQFRDIALFVGAVWFVIWLFGKFHWGVVFWGGLLQLVVILGLGASLMWRLYRRMLDSKAPT